MSLLDSNAPSSGIFSAIKGALNLFTGLNKTKSGNDNFNPNPQDEYEFSYTDEDIIALIGDWKRTYAKYYKDIEESCTLSFEYWLGKQRTEDMDSVKGGITLIDNQIFQAIETFIPIATRANPDPIVTADTSESGQALAAAVKAMLVNEASRQSLKKILKKVLRQWMIYKIGAVKTSYDLVHDQIETDWINPKRFIFDKDGHIDEFGKLTGKYIGERKIITANKLAELFPKKRMMIALKCGNKWGTQLEYIEWWYLGTDVFYTMDDVLLGKFKNPHWNYDQKETKDESGNVSPETEGKNFADKPTDPYVFLSIFSTGLQPHDETSLITQNIGLQDLINKRIRQIDRNVDGMNNGLVVSSDFTSDQASLAAAALRKGTAIRSASKDVTKSVMRLPATGLPSDVYGQLRDVRQEIQNIFGTSGSTPQGQASEETARGKILINQLDASRIGGGITEYVEAMAETVYKQWVQLMYVHFTEEHYVLSADSVNGQTLISLKNTDFLLSKTLRIQVKDGSLVPKDSLTERNQAVDLWSAEAIDPLSFYKKLDFPDPVEATTQLILWQMLQKGQIQPQQYLPSFNVRQPQQPEQTAGGGPQLQPAVAPNTPSPQPPEGTQNAVEEQSKQLAESIPIKA